MTPTVGKKAHVVPLLDLGPEAIFRVSAPRFWAAIINRIAGPAREPHDPAWQNAPPDKAPMGSAGAVRSAIAADASSSTFGRNAIKCNFFTVDSRKADAAPDTDGAQRGQR